MSDTRPVDDEDAAVAYTDPSQSAHKPATGGHGGGGQGGAGGSAAQVAVLQQMAISAASNVGTAAAMTSAGVAAGVARGAAITTSIIATAVSVAVVASAVASAPVESTIVPRPTNYYIRKTVLRLRQRLVSFEWKSSRSTNRWMGRLL
ncbi:hypothetical protein FisN_18Hu296 [Fistulifera solaris]|uniref:Uncharacterized protein n=1 Tax=Fistulifera solaris TaxID=1519565 RepID=A0A1Z5KJQ8_FISSO|nr:hypothetical protein FisN_18Hu296 [Fistulifera solaris]|eukprot:GAX26178.1 hypothetical protein FisN_18Hu296 [Fistulifera solaris]